MTSDHTVPVLRKALAVLHAVASAEGPSTTKAIAASLGLSPSTTYRILRTYLAENWLRSTQEGGHKLSFGLLPIVEPLIVPEVLTKVARTPLSELAARTGLLAKLSVRDGDHAVTVFRAGRPPPGGLLRSGDSMHLAVGATGSALLCGLPPGERRELVARAPKECWRLQRPTDLTRRLRMLATEGHCIAVGGFHPDVAALSTPLHGPCGRIVAAATLVGTISAITTDTSALAEHLIRTVEQCRGLLSQSVPFSHDLES